tara:strand:- start:1466 stop:3145 length:1680 start_codon:yes stop_codon:yes gene_type:complete
MAYNVLKGNVQFINSDSGSIESMVDDHSNQTIAGIKTFSTVITASGFFNSSDGGSVLVSSPITTLFGAGEDRVAIFSGSSDLTASTGFTYNQTVLAVTGNISASANVSGSGFYGSGIGLTALPAASITGQVSAANINIGNGLHNSSTTLAVTASDSSITVAGTGISINGAGSTSGLVVGGSGIRVDPNRGTAIGALASGDEFLVADVDDSNNLKKSTITQLQTYMQNSLTFGGAAGSDTQVQFNSSGDFAGDSTFTFNSTSNVLSVSGLSASLNVSASAFYGDGANITNVNATSINGSVPAANLNIGKGLFNDSNSLAVSASYGLTASANGLEVTASATSGLDVLASTGLVVSPLRATAKSTPVAADTILIGDSAASGQVKNTTLTNIITLTKNNGAGGSNTQVQFNSSNAFAGDNAFTFNAATNTLAVQEISSSGNISASFFYGDGSNLQNIGGTTSYNSFTANFNVLKEHDFIGIVTTGSVITASLPTAATYNPGQRVTFKDVSGSCSGSNHIVISASAYGSGDRIDGAGVVKIQVGFGAVTLASDGVGSYYIVSAT